MNVFKKFFLLLIFFGFANAAENKSIVWPSAPQKPRIIFEQIITKSEDLKIEKSFFSVFIDFIAGNEKEVLIRPFGVYVNDNTLYVTDTGSNSVNIFNQNEKSFISIEGIKKQNFKSPIDVKVDNKKNIYVTDSILSAVYIFDRKGEYLRKFAPDYNFHRPTGLAIDKLNKKIYISDTVKNSIEVFTFDGEHLQTIGKYGSLDAEFNKPTFLCVDNEGKLYVVDSMNQRVQVFDKDGVFKLKFGQRGKTAGTFANPRGITVDNQGNIYITDTLFNVVQIFNKKGQLLLLFGKEGIEKGSFSLPAGITIDKNGNLYVADSYNMRIQYFKKITYDDDK